MESTETTIRSQLSLEIERGAEEGLEREKRVLDALATARPHNSRFTTRRIRYFLELYESRPQTWEQMERYLRRYGINYLGRTVYKPIRQIAAFENLVLPHSWHEHQARYARDFVWVFLQVFFSGETITREGEVFRLRFRSPEYRRSYYLKRLSEDPTWSDTFFSREHPEMLRIMSEQNPEECFNGLVDYRGMETVTVEGEEGQSYEAPLIMIDLSDRGLGINRSPMASSELLGNLYRNLRGLLDFGRGIHFLSDVYRPFYQEVWALYEAEEERHKEEYEQAVERFTEALEQRILPVSELGHKTAQADAEKNNIAEVFVPFEEKKDLLPTGTPVYVYMNQAGDWLIYPPTSRPFVNQELTYCGIFSYLNYNEGRKQHYVAQLNSQEGDGAEYMAAVKLDDYNRILREHYADWEHYSAVENGLRLLASYPKTFAKSTLTFEATEGLILPEETQGIRPAEPVKNPEPVTSQEAARVINPILIPVGPNGEEENPRLMRELHVGSVVLRINEQQSPYLVTSLAVPGQENHILATALQGPHSGPQSMPISGFRFPGPNESASYWINLFLESRLDSPEFLALLPFAAEQLQRETGVSEEKSLANVRHKHLLRNSPERFHEGRLSVCRAGSYAFVTHGRTMVGYRELTESMPLRMAVNAILDDASQREGGTRGLGLSPGANLVPIYSIQSQSIIDGLIYHAN